jgi:cysteine sulfinate desulfinase/cysteine desulfurase-like protein
VNIPAIVGFEEAMRETERIREKRTKAIGTVKEAFWKKLKQAVKKSGAERRPGKAICTSQGIPSPYREFSSSRRFRGTAGHRA